MTDEPAERVIAFLERIAVIVEQIEMTDEQMERMITLLERIADALEMIAGDGANR